MKILIIDDQQLILLPIQNRLEELGYKVKIETDSLKGLNRYHTFQPDLLIVDVSMSKNPGIEVIRYIRKRENSKVPIMALSGDIKYSLLKQGFEVGIDDYMKKPLSLNELCARVERLIEKPYTGVVFENEDDVIINQRCVGVVIPCYNEEKRLLSKEFTSFLSKNSGYHLCFVNDGSSDNTLAALNSLRKGRESFISVYDCRQNGGKAEAVRLGMLYMAEKPDLDYIGFLDADLSTDLKDFDDLVSTIENSKFKIVSGSRISRMGANITKESARQVISKTINLIIRNILSMHFKDTQCGAKIFHKDIIDIAFAEKFITKWLFDVEIFIRIRKYFNLENAKQMICEQPLKRWIHADGSKLSMKDSVKIVGQLAQIAWVYRKRKKQSIKRIYRSNNIVVGKRLRKTIHANFNEVSALN